MGLLSIDWSTDMSILTEFILMIVGVKIFYVIFDYVYTLASGNWYKLATNLGASLLYKHKLTYEETLNYDGAPVDIVSKRKDALKSLEKRLNKFNYTSISPDYKILSTDGKINPSIGMYIPYVFSSILSQFKYYTPCLFTSFDPDSGCKLIDIAGNKLFDLSSGNGVNIIGNTKIAELTSLNSSEISGDNHTDTNNGSNGYVKVTSDSIPFQVGFSNIHTIHAIKNILEIMNRRRKHHTDSENPKARKTIHYNCVSFIESGSSAVESCIKQARFYHYTFGNVQRKRIIVFKNAYHGWQVNPYLNNYNPDPNIIILDALSKDSLQYIVSNYLKIAAIFMDPMKILSVNAIYPRESLTLGARQSEYGRNKKSLTQHYINFMRKVDEMCKEYNILFVLDECYSGFRVGPYGAAVEYDLHPEMLILSKQIGCGLNTTCVVGTQEVMQRKKKTLNPTEMKENELIVGAAGGSTAEVVFVTGTGSTNPQHHRMVRKFTQYALSKEYEEIHENKMKMFDNWCIEVNNEFEKRNLPVKLSNYYNTFSVDLLCNSYYNWMYCIKLVSLGCVFTPGGTTKFTLSFDYNNELLNELRLLFIQAAEEMKDEGWFYDNSINGKDNIETNHKKRVLIDGIKYNLYMYLYLFFDTIRIDKIIDVACSHNHPVNRWTHFWSSILQLSISYPMWYYNYKYEAMLTFLIFHVLRQTGHFFFEAQLVHDEKVKIGYKNATKKRFAYGIPIALGIFLLLEYIYPLHFDFKKMFVLGGLFSVVNRFVDISECHGFMRSFCWFVKIITDVVSDLYDMSDYWNPFAIKEKDWKVDWHKINQNHQSYSLDF